MKKIYCITIFVVAWALSVVQSQAKESTVLERFKPIDTFSQDFKCVFEAQNSPLLLKEADEYFMEARRLEQTYQYDDDVAINLIYQKAVALGHWKAAYNLAMRYRQGKGVENFTYQKALELLEPMAVANIPIGIYGMAVMIKEGQGVKRDAKLASQYMHRAAELGSPLAQQYLGGVAYGRYDYRQAKDYYLCAALQGNREAAYQLAMNARVGEQNYPKTVRYFQLAASLGHKKSFASLSMIFGAKKEENNLGYGQRIELEECLYQKEKQLNREPWITFPNLDKECPIPLHPIMGDGSEYPYLETREPGFLERLKTTGHDPENEQKMGEARMKWLRNFNGAMNDAPSIEVVPEEILPTVPLEGLDQWTMAQVQQGEFLVKRDGRWIYVKNGKEVPSNITGYLAGVLGTYYTPILEVEAFHQDTDGKFRITLRSMLG